MFGKPANPYDDIIAKATDEKQTEINWETALSVWDKVNEDGESGARNSVNALTKRLTHRSANVQLFALTLAGALVNNCGPPVHREISGKAFTQALTRLVNDRTTHDSVKKEALNQIEQWVREHPNNSDFDLLSDTYESLKRQNHQFPSTMTRNPTPPRINDDALRKEEEDLQRALAESAALSNPLRNGNSDGYQPSSSSAAAVPEARGETAVPAEARPTRVQALYDFVGQTPDELEFKRGDVIKVVECLYEDWWKGENLNRPGKVGIFPRNHIQPLPEEPHGTQPRSTLTSEEEDLEAEVFGQVALVDRLLALMAQLRERGQDFADNDELTDLYNSSMRLRPRVVKLIRKYDQKQADLESMSQKVNQARGIYEGMMMNPRQQQPSAHAAYHQQSPAQANAYSHPQQPHPHSQQQQQQQPQDFVQAQPEQDQHRPGPPNLDPEEELRQKREYELKWAEYERQMEEYNRQMAAHQQFYQQQQQTQPQPDLQRSQSYSNASLTPHPQVGLEQHHHSQPIPASSGSRGPVPQQQPQPQPVWDGQAWVWPTQIAQVPHNQQPQSPPAPESLQHEPSMVPVPHPVHSPQPHPSTSPVPRSALYSSPPPPNHMSGVGYDRLAQGVASMGLGENGHHAVGSAGGTDPAQAQWANQPPTHPPQQQPSW